MHRLYKIWFVGMLLIPFYVTGQYITNPSFESEWFGEYNPEGWTLCNSNTTIDVQPGIWAIETRPSHGNSYLGLTARGANLQMPKNEAAQTELTGPLLAGECYDLSIDLAQGISIDGLYTYTDPLKIAVWGGAYYCDKAEKLAETPKIDHQEWQTYNFLLQPSETYSFFILEIMLDDDNERGYLLLDNLTLKDTKENRYVVKMDTVVRPDDPLYLEASEGSRYVWWPQEGLGCYNCRVREVNVEYSRAFICRIFDSNGCPFEEAFNVTINVFIPNVFTPNGDGVNDFFRVDGLRPGSVLKVFDRRGQLVFENTNYENNWYGKGNRGEKLPEDTYWYVLKIPDDLQEYTGYVYIKR